MTRPDYHASSVTGGSTWFLNARTEIFERKRAINLYVRSFAISRLFCQLDSVDLDDLAASIALRLKQATGRHFMSRLMVGKDMLVLSLL